MVVFKVRERFSLKSNRDDAINNSLVELSDRFAD
jgi:hypothetical protein